MKNKNLKKLITFGVLILVLGGLVAGTLLLKKLNSEEEPTEEETTIEVFDKGSTIVTAFSFKTKDEEMSFSYINDDWVYDKDSKFPLNQDRVASMAAAVGKITATEKIEKPSEDLSDYGLTKAALTVVATFSDGSEKTFLFGDTNGFNNCQYFSLSGDSSIYMVETSVATSFAADLDYLYKAETYQLMKDAVSDTDVSSITITTENGQKKEISDDKGIEELYELVYTLDLSEYEDYYADENELKYEYGISSEGERITVHYTYETKGSDGSTQKLPKEYTVYIGYKYEDAEEETEDSTPGTDAEKEEKKHSYFYSFKDSSVVYTVDGETVDDIFGFLAYEPKVTDTTAAE